MLHLQETWVSVSTQRGQYLSTLTIQIENKEFGSDMRGVQSKHFLLWMQRAAAGRERREDFHTGVLAWHAAQEAAARSARCYSALCRQTLYHVIGP